MNSLCASAGTLGRMAPTLAMPSWLARTRVLIVAGKGGVGTTTVAASLAVLAAEAGADVLLVAVDGKPGLGPLLGGTALVEREQMLRHASAGSTGRVRGRTIEPKQAFGDYLALKGVGGILRKAASAASLDMIAASTPGLEHLLVLGKIKELDREKAADLIIVDVPPAGHAAPFLRSASALQKVVASGPVRDQADEVSAMLADHGRAQCLMVTLAEETPVNEVIELAYDLEEDLGLALAPLVVNACWPERKGLAMSATAAAKSQKVKLSAADRDALDHAAAFGRARLSGQHEQLARLDELLPLPRLHVPRLPTARLHSADLETLAAALAVEPMLPGGVS
jgi:arsenite/tail-anchored protein-transporting ATPase